MPLTKIKGSSIDTTSDVTINQLTATGNVAVTGNVAITGNNITMANHFTVTDTHIKSEGQVLFMDPAQGVWMKNMIINGDFMWWQRGTSASGITTSSYRTADRWQLSLNSCGTWSEARSTEVPANTGLVYSVKLDCTTADASPAAGDYVIWQQRIEGGMLRGIRKGLTDAQKVTVSFWTRSNTTGTYAVELRDHQNTRFLAKLYTIDVADTWQKVELTFDADTTGTLGYDTSARMYLQFWLASGSTYAGGTLGTTWHTTEANRVAGISNLAADTANEIYFAGIQMEVGANASGFEFLPRHVQEKQMYRYYYFETWHGRRGGGRFFRCNNRTQGTWELPTIMRGTPSFSGTRTYGDGIWGSGNIYGGNGWTDPLHPEFINFESSVNPESGSGNGGTFRFTVYATAEL